MLTIVNCTAEDQGAYKVVASNPLGEASCSANLNVVEGRLNVDLKDVVNFST